jgi:cysteinyl-tRNA synthetase
MTLTLYNSLTRRKETFTPLDPKKVRMYVCGPTVYDRPHLGNARAVVVYDVLFRLLRHLYGEEHVVYARNITDVDDKIIEAAKQRGIPIDELTREVTQWFHDDMAALNCLPPTVEPKATEYIPHMIAMIEKLIANDHAYEAQGHVLFDVTSDADYGVLSGRRLEELKAGARVEVEGYKRNPGDFVLWKPGNPGDPESSLFDSPWGKGRPGWHIECSAMSTDLLGETFDIHGGGADLKFPHHENEIAQSCCANPGSEFAKLWMHNGFLTVNGEKMSKSLGNFITVRDLLDKGVGESVLRIALLTSKYSDPLNWTSKLIEDAKKLHIKISAYIFKNLLCEEFQKFSFGEKNWKITYDKKLNVSELLDDINIPMLFARINKIMSSKARDNAAELESLIQLLGIKPKLFIPAYGDLIVGDGERYSNVYDFHVNNPANKGRFEKRSESLKIASDVDAQIQARNEAKKAKDFAKADAIRKELEAQGIILEDKRDGTTEWRRA